MTPCFTRTDLATFLPSFSSCAEATCFLPAPLWVDVSATLSCTVSLDFADVLTAAEVAETDATVLLPETDERVADWAAEDPVAVPLMLTLPLMAEDGGTCTLPDIDPPRKSRCGEFRVTVLPRMPAGGMMILPCCAVSVISPSFRELM